MRASHTSRPRCSTPRRAPPAPPTRCASHPTTRAPRSTPLRHRAFDPPHQATPCSSAKSSARCDQRRCDARSRDVPLRAPSPWPARPTRHRSSAPPADAPAPRRSAPRLYTARPAALRSCHATCDRHGAAPSRSRGHTTRSHHRPAPERARSRRRASARTAESWPGTEPRAARAIAGSSGHRAHHRGHTAAQRSGRSDRQAGTRPQNKPAPGDRAAAPPLRSPYRSTRRHTTKAGRAAGCRPPHSSSPRRRACRSQRDLARPPDTDRATCPRRAPKTAGSPRPAPPPSTARRAPDHARPPGETAAHRRSRERRASEARWCAATHIRCHPLRAHAAARHASARCNRASE